MMTADTATDLKQPILNNYRDHLVPTTLDHDSVHEAKGLVPDRWIHYRDVIEKRFDILQRNSTIEREIQAGVILFCTCAYIFIMNPNILAIADFDKNETYITTILVAVFGSSTIGWFYNLPLIISPAMGLNTLMAVELVSTKRIPVNEALGAAFLTGLILLILSKTGIIMKLVRITPTCLKKSIIVSLGLFQAVIGMASLHLIQPSTGGSGGVSTIGESLASPEIMVASFTIISTMLLVVYGIEGSLLYGIIGGSIIARLVGATLNGEPTVEQDGLSSLIGALSLPHSMSALIKFLTSAGTMFLVTFIDAGGVLLGLASQDVVLQDENGMMKHSEGVFFCTGLCGMFSAFIGCSPPVILLESAAGINFGARTGLATLTAVGLFICCLLFRGLVDLVPPCVGHAVLIIVGSFMMGAVTGITWDNISEAFPSYATIIATVFTCSLANGATTGFVVYGILHLPTWIDWLLCKDVSPTTNPSSENVRNFDEVNLEEMGRRISISDWTQMGLGDRTEFKYKFGHQYRWRRTMSTPDSVV